MAKGLEGVVAAETILSHTDPANGMVWVRGVDLPGLVSRYQFEGTVALLWDGFAGQGLTRAGMLHTLGGARVAAYDAGRLRLADGTVIRTDRLVVATGADPSHLAPELGALTPIKGQLLNFVGAPSGRGGTACLAAKRSWVEGSHSRT